MNDLLRSVPSTKKWVLLTIVFSLLSACSTFDRTNCPIGSQWAVLPVAAATEEASILVEHLLARILAEKGFRHLQAPSENWINDQAKTLQDAHKLKNAIQWAQQRGMGRGLTGTVDHWYRDDKGRSQVGLTIKVLDISSNTALWTTSGSGEGRSEDLLSDVADNLVEMLLVSLKSFEGRESFSLPSKDSP